MPPFFFFFFFRGHKIPLPLGQFGLTCNFPGWDIQTQWKKRKQSKAESARIKKAKLDPDALVSAAEVRDKRAIESSEEDERGVSGGGGMAVELGSGKKEGKRGEKEKEEQDSTGDEEGSRRKRKIRAKTDNTKGGRQQQQGKPLSKMDTKENQPSLRPMKSLEKKKLRQAQHIEEGEERGKDEKKRVAPNKLGDREKVNTDSTIVLPSSPNDSKADSVYTSESSISASASPTLSNITTATTPPSSVPGSQSVAGSNTAAAGKAKSDDSILDMRARLAARIEALRAARKAVGTKPSDPNGPAPPRNRQELMEARAKKEVLRKAKRAEAKAKAKAAAAAAATAAAATPPTNGIVASSSRGTSVDGHVSPVPSISTNYSFGKVVFDDGEALDASLRGAASTKERKRASGGDTKALLEHVQRKKARLEGMDEGKRVRVEESERWGKAIAKVAGEKVKDDEKLLKKAMKRVESRKRKSEKEWLVTSFPPPHFYYYYYYYYLPRDSLHKL